MHICVGVGAWRVRSGGVRGRVVVAFPVGGAGILCQWWLWLWSAGGNGLPLVRPVSGAFVRLLVVPLPSLPSVARFLRPLCLFLCLG